MEEDIRKNILRSSLDKYIEENYVPLKPFRSLKSRPKIRSAFEKKAYSAQGNAMAECCDACEAAPCEGRERSLDDILKHVDDTFSQALFRHIDGKGLKDTDVYKKAHIDRKLFSKIRSNKDFKPSKKTAICLCFGLELDLDGSLDLLGKAGYTLSHSSKSDLVVEYFLKTKEYDLNILNEILYDYGLDTLYV